jgi:hypothetical protein
MGQVIRRVLTLVIAIFALGFSGAALAADQGSDDCAKTQCREGGFQIALTVDKEHYTTIPVTHSPYVLPDGAILIFPGETLVFRLPLDGDKIGTPVFVAEYAPEMPAERDPNAPPPPFRDLPKLKGDLGADQLAPFPEGTFIVSYGQHGREPGMFMVMMHNLPKTAKLDAVMSIITPGKYELHPTSTCPLMPKIFGMENWPHPIGPMILKNLRVLPDGSGIVCD